MFTLAVVAEEPRALTHRLDLGDGSVGVFRPLTHADVVRLAGFLAGLSAETRRLSAFDTYDLAAARDLCDAIARYDKLRMVVEETTSGRIVGLFEFSFDLHPSDITRYRTAGIRLTAADCRFGLTLADGHQGRGVGTRAFPLITDIAQLFGRRRIILLGGVLADNTRAIRYYRKHGFHPVGAFTGPDGTHSLDMILDLHPPSS